MKVEDKFWEMDSLHEEVIDEFVIEMGGSSSSEDADNSAVIAPVSLQIVIERMF